MSSRFMASPIRNLALGVVYMLVVMAVAVAAYVAVGWRFGDALYMVIITVYTVGYGETIPIDTPLLRAITITTIVLGCTGMIYLTGALVQFITVDRLNSIFGTNRMNTQIDRLSNHVIICGFGRLGAMLAQELSAADVPIVVLEKSETAIELARDLGHLCIHTDATDEEALRAAGILRARTLATVLSNDAANVFITLSARSLNPGLEIIARGELPSTESKLLQAGANKVVLPAHIGAERIAELILYSKTAALIRGSVQMREFERNLLALGLDMEIVVAAPESPVVGMTVDMIEHHGEGGFLVIQVNRKTGEAIARPGKDLVIEPGDGVFVLGRGGAQALSDLFGHRPRGGRVP
ncbi:MAG TPA: NAD-binding protein [Rhodopila sp.]|uniref:potassium channel family protein n=1 Tax=Rhodopila sp. TaxID=2480087 RepID=UPI002CFE9F85|nr:NAD-binding protein [Rhodopila sp.]HVY16136.1 NAD-binding protein [Rhodopila sp.]